MYVCIMITKINILNREKNLENNKITCIFYSAAKYSFILDKVIVQVHTNHPQIHFLLIENCLFDDQLFDIYYGKKKICSLFHPFSIQMVEDILFAISKTYLPTEHLKKRKLETAEETH